MNSILHLEEKLSKPAYRILDEVLDEMTPTIDRDPTQTKEVQGIIIRCVEELVRDTKRPIAYTSLSSGLLGYSQREENSLAQGELEMLAQIFGYLTKITKGKYTPLATR